MKTLEKHQHFSSFPTTIRQQIFPIELLGTYHDMYVKGTELPARYSANRRTITCPMPIVGIVDSLTVESRGPMA